jgi:hypothetical protein
MRDAVDIQGNEEEEEKKQKQKVWSPCSVTVVGLRSNKPQPARDIPERAQQPS